jgi:hypothetical protein
MNYNFNQAIGNLICHFYQQHQILLTEPEIWLINNILLCSDDMFEPFEIISDMIGIALTSIDHAAIIKYHYTLDKIADTVYRTNTGPQFSLN